MLYGAEITKDIIDDENKLCEQLYLFLGRYLNKSLIYESNESIEDFTQDAIMFLLKRFNKLTKEQKETINLEKFFYNRTRSFIGNKIRWKKERYKLFKKYAEELKYMESMNKSETQFIDSNLLISIVNKYKLNKEKSEVLKDLAYNKLILLGYFGDAKELNEDDLDPNGTLDILSYSVVDEYLISTVRGGLNRQ